MNRSPWVERIDGQDQQLCLFTEVPVKLGRFSFGDTIHIRIYSTFLQCCTVQFKLDQSIDLSPLFLVIRGIYIYYTIMAYLAVFEPHQTW